MTDIVERLRAPAYWISGSDEGHEGENNAPYEAAARIEQLEGQHKGLVLQNALLRQRPDLPVDRIPAAAEVRALIARIEQLEAALRDIADGMGETDLAEVGRYARHIARRGAAVQGKPIETAPDYHEFSSDYYRPSSCTICTYPRRHPIHLPPPPPAGETND